MDIRLENVRCFANSGPARIAPLTILIGENSTGKSSFLSLLRIAYKMVRGELPRFNAEPFLWGSYSQIANCRPEQAPSKNFRLALSLDCQFSEKINGEGSAKAQIDLEFTNIDGHPHLDRYKISCLDYAFEVIRKNHEINKTTGFFEFPSNERIELPEAYTESLLERDSSRHEDMTLPFHLFLHLADPLPFHRGLDRNRDLGEKVKKVPNEEIEAFKEILIAVSNHFECIPYAFAPIRAKPERTYNPIEYRTNPEGSRVPMKLAHFKSSRREEWQEMRKIISDYGTRSGLFEEIDIKTLGKHEEEPFQLTAKIAGLSSNLMDTGYGVSQVLPLIVDLHEFMGDRPYLYLLQQPEVHLHPRAQAELGSFLSRYVIKTKNKVAVETHSDHLVDRIRMSIRDIDELTPEHVSLLFFERVGTNVKIHNLKLDDSGSLVDPPPSYRDFFLNEQFDLLDV